MAANESDITAVVLSIGEASLSRALESLEAQTLLPAEIVLIEHVEPISKAFCQGFQQVTTPFFLQCDADMVLAPDCLAVLRNAMDEDIAVCAGYLQDEILGPVQAVKMFRTAALKEGYRDSITCDSDLISELFSRGWRLKFCRRGARSFDLDAHVMGHHSPDYQDPAYTFYKFYRHGATVRHRQCYPEYEAMLGALKSSEHPMANLALTAFCRGLFELHSHNLHVVPSEIPEYREFRSFKNTESDLATLVFATTQLPGLDVAVFPGAKPTKVDSGVAIHQMDS